MSEFKLPHVEDLTTNSKLPGQLTEDFKAIEQALSDEVTDRKKGDGNLQGQIDDLQERCQKLEDQVKRLQKDNDDHEERLKKIERLLFGSETITVTDPTDDIKASQQAVEISDTDDTDDSVSVVTIN